MILLPKTAESENRPEKAAARHKPSLFVADAFSNPRHVQFALKVTLAGMIGYLFYTASDYYGIHTVFYTPLIIALASTGATIHKGFLRIVGLHYRRRFRSHLFNLGDSKIRDAGNIPLHCLLRAWLGGMDRLRQRANLVHGPSDSIGL